MTCTCFFVALPVVTTDLPTYFVKYGKNITLPCSVSSTPIQSNVYWEKTVDDRDTFIYSGTTGTRGISLSSPSLTIDSVLETDNGNYTCIAINSLGITQSMTSSLTVLGGMFHIFTLKSNFRRQIVLQLSSYVKELVNHIIVWQYVLLIDTIPLGTLISWFGQSLHIRIKNKESVNFNEHENSLLYNTNKIQTQKNVSKTQQ